MIAKNINNTDEANRLVLRGIFVPPSSFINGNNMLLTLAIKSIIFYINAVSIIHFADKISDIEMIR